VLWAPHSVVLYLVLQSQDPGYKIFIACHHPALSARELSTTFSGKPWQPRSGDFVAYFPGKGSMGASVRWASSHDFVSGSTLIDAGLCRSGSLIHVTSCWCYLLRQHSAIIGLRQHNGSVMHSTFGN
jgi:hypothetical protein